MTELTFKVNLKGITSLECFKDASKDEIKVLVALAALGTESTTAEELADEIGISKARVAAAIALFEESGVIARCETGIYAEVEYEFEPKKSESKSDSKLEVARSIRDNDLYEMNVELENIFEKTLEVREIERLTSLYTKKGLSIPYILTLTVHLKDVSQVLSVEKVVREATKLIDKGISTLEELEVYIKEKTEEVAGEMEMRHLLGIRGRTLTKTEREFFKKWLHDYGYSITIIGEAYDITVNATGDKSVSYMDKILTTWHEAGCTTLEECRAKVMMRKQENAKNVKNSGQKSKKNIEAETPKYTDFNSEDALLRALERSYGESD